MFVPVLSSAIAIGIARLRRGEKKVIGAEESQSHPSQLVVLFRGRAVSFRLESSSRSLVFDLSQYMLQALYFLSL